MKKSMEEIKTELIELITNFDARGVRAEDADEIKADCIRAINEAFSEFENQTPGLKKS